MKHDARSACEFTPHTLQQTSRREAGRCSRPHAVAANCRASGRCRKAANLLAATRCCKAAANCRAAGRAMPLQLIAEPQVGAAARPARPVVVQPFCVFQRKTQKVVRVGGFFLKPPKVPAYRVFGGFLKATKTSLPLVNS